VGICAHDHRLNDAALADRGGETFELLLGEVAARVARIGLEIFDRHAAMRARRLRRSRLDADISHQRGKAAAQSRSAVIAHGFIRLERISMRWNRTPSWPGLSP